MTVDLPLETISDRGCWVSITVGLGIACARIGRNGQNDVIAEGRASDTKLQVAIDNAVTELCAIS